MSVVPTAVVPAGRTFVSAVCVLNLLKRDNEVSPAELAQPIIIRTLSPLFTHAYVYV